MQQILRLHPGKAAKQKEEPQEELVMVFHESRITLGGANSTLHVIAKSRAGYLFAIKYTFQCVEYQTNTYTRLFDARFLLRKQLKRYLSPAVVHC